jgi:hypothetical protein
MRKIVFLLMLIVSVCGSASAQNKNIDKANETLSKAMSTEDAAKRQELLNKAIELYREGGMTREMYPIIGDAFLEKGDLTNASSYYNRSDKEGKKAGLRKVADAYVNEAFSGDEKNRPKLLAKAASFYGKSDASREGAIIIGDKFYELGEKYYNDALGYYMQVQAYQKAELIAKEFLSKDNSSKVKAAEIYRQLNTPEGFKTAGEIYYGMKEYAKAFDAWTSGEYAEGIKQYGEQMFASKKFDYADIAYNKAADIYLKAKDVNSIEKLADDMRKKGLFTSAEKLYMKSGNTPFAMKCKAFDKILAFQYDSARIFLDQANEPLIAKALKDNTKNIKGMEDIAMNLESISGGQPYVNYLTDSTTGKTYLNSVDEKVLNEYYGMVKDQIVDNIMRLSSLMKLVTNADLREILKAKFQKYAAVGKILDPATYAPKIQKAQVTVKDVYLQ